MTTSQCDGSIFVFASRSKRRQDKKPDTLGGYEKVSVGSDVRHGLAALDTNRNPDADLGSNK